MKLLRVRALIDAVDHAIVVLLAKRAALVRHAFAHKGAEKLDPAREAEMMRARRGWAREAGLPEEQVEAAFKQILLATRPPL